MSTLDVLGQPLAPGGKVLFHEHIQMGWPGHLLDYRARRADVAESARALDELADAGYGVIVDATTLELGRDLALLTAIASRTRLQVVASVGIYHAQRGFPDHLASLSVDELTDLYRHDLHGANRAGRAGVIKIATERLPFARRERKAIEAAGEVCGQDGVSIVSHAVYLPVAREQLAILKAAGAQLSRVVLGHLDAEWDDPDGVAALAAEGVFIGVDRFGGRNDPSDLERVALLRGLRARGHHRSLLISHDKPLTFLGRLEVGEPGVNPYLHIETVVLPMLRAAGFSEADIEQVQVRNPRRWLGYDNS